MIVIIIRKVKSLINLCLINWLIKKNSPLMSFKNLKVKAKYTKSIIEKEELMEPSELFFLCLSAWTRVFFSFEISFMHYN